MIDHPSVFRRARDTASENADDPVIEEAFDCLFDDEVSAGLRSPGYWLRVPAPEAESALEAERESKLRSLSVDPDQMQMGLVDVRDYLPTRPRRVSRRLRAPQQLVIAYRPFEYVPMELHILTPGPAQEFIPCFLYDVNDQGICLASPVPLATGTEVWFCAHHREEPTALLSLQVPVLNQRPCPASDALHALFEDGGLWLHGLKTPQRDARLLLRCALDSLACNQAQQGDGAIRQAS